MRKTPRLAASAIGATALLFITLALSGVAPSDAGILARGPAQWTSDQVSMIASLSVDKLAAAPNDPSNAADGQPGAIALGRALFSDPRFSRDGSVSCASCHAPDKQFQDGLPVARGVGLGTRRAMPVVGTGHNAWFFWDGRKDSLWSQALGPLEDRVEHGGNRGRYARLLQTNYKSRYEAVFGSMPMLGGVRSDASPLGTDDEQLAWQSMPAGQRENVDRVFSNMGKAIAAYEKRLTYGESRFDRYARDIAANDASGRGELTPQEVNGLRVFIGNGQCVTCHNGPLLTDQAFHNTGVPPRDSARPDRGRAAAGAKVQADAFNCLGHFSDARPDQCSELRFMVTDDPALEGAFKTPSLRNVGLRPPYMHAGQFATLEQVVNHYMQSPAAVLGHSELARGKRDNHAERKPIRLSQEEARDLVAFLATLSGPIVEKAAP
jgi:cytochrome c peroxidase